MCANDDDHKWLELTAVADQPEYNL